MITAILARGLGHEQFGSIGVMLGVYYFVGGFHRANVVLPFIVAAPEEERSGGSLDSWWRINVMWIALITLVLGLATAVVSVVLPHEGWIVTALEYAAITTPALLLADFGRRWLYQRHMSATVALASLVYAVVGAGVALVSFKIRSGWMGVAAWTAAGLAAFLAARIALPPGPATWRSAAASWFEHRRFGLWLSACHIPFALYNSSVVVLIGLFGGPAAAAGFTATRTLTNPALSVVAAVDSLDKPRAARALVANGLAGLNDSIHRTRRLLASVTGLYLGLIVLIPDLVLRLVFGQAYAGRGMEVRVLAGAFFLMCLNQPSETLLVVLRRGVLMFSIRTLTAVVALIGLWWGGRLGGVLGSAWALLAIQTFNLIALRIGEYLAESQYRVALQSGLAPPVTLPPPGFVDSPIALEEG